MNKVIITPEPGSKEERIIGLFVRNINRLLSGRITNNQYERSRARITEVWKRVDAKGRQLELFT